MTSNMAAWDEAKKWAVRERKQRTMPSFLRSLMLLERGRERDRERIYFLATTMDMFSF